MPVNSFSHYPGGFTHGVTLRGLSVLNVHYGNVFWVDSGVGNDSGGADGSITKPFATIDYAVGRCTANNGDLIMVAPGHTETIAAAGGIDLDVAGISIIGLGNGRERPTISFTATGSDIDIDAANIYVENLHIDMTGVDAVTGGIDVNAADFSLVGCDILMADSDGQATRGIVGATEADRMKILGNTIRSTTAGAASCINLVGTADGVEIAHNYIYGDFSVAAIENATGAGNVHTNLEINHNYIQNDNNGNWAIELVAASTGTIRNNHCVTDAIATAVDWGGCSAFNNWYWDDSDTDTAATAIPTAQTTGGMDLVTIGERLGADADTDAIAAMLGGAAGIATMPAAAVPANAVNVFELLRQIWANQAGTAANENGITTWPSAAVPGNNVSLAEVLRDLWDAVRNGTGGAEPATNRSVMDYLGVTPAFFVPGLGYKVTKAANMQATSDDLFDITGTVLVTLIYGEVTAALDGTVTTALIRVKTDNVNLCAATTVTSDADGTMYMLTGHSGALMNGGAAPVLRTAGATELNDGGTNDYVQALAPRIVGNAGVAAVLEQILGAADVATGAVTWTLFYMPLDTSATVTASA